MDSAAEPVISPPEYECNFCEEGTFNYATLWKGMCCDCYSQAQKCGILECHDW